MRRALLAVVMLASACKGNERPPPHTTAGSATPIDAGAAPADSVRGPVLDPVSCAPAPLAPVGPGASPHVTLGKTTEGGVKGAADVLRKHENRLRFCYEQNLGREPTLAGTSKLSIIIQETGAVHEVIVDDSIDNELSLCMKHIISELHFPASKTQTTVVQPITFAWTPGLSRATEPTAWIPYASSAALVPTEVAVVAAVNLHKALPLAKLASCMGNQTGSLRTIAKIDTDGSVTVARAGGFGDRATEACISAALVGVKIDPVPVVTEVACDFVRGDPAPWRMTPDAGYTVIDAAQPLRPPAPKPGQTFLVLVDPTTPAAVISSAVRLVTPGAAYAVAMRIDAGPPLFLLASRGAAAAPDPAAPVLLDAREPLRICGGLLDAPVTGPFTDADKLIGAAAKRCTHRPCPTQLTIGVAERTADQLATLVATARRAGFERIRLGDGTCPK